MGTVDDGLAGMGIDDHGLAPESEVIGGKQVMATSIAFAMERLGKELIGRG